VLTVDAGSNGRNFFERAVLLVGQLGQVHYLVLAIGVVAIVLLVSNRSIRLCNRICSSSRICFFTIRCADRRKAALKRDLERRRAYRPGRVPWSLSNSLRRNNF
jgi:hypothetical protein